MPGDNDQQVTVKTEAGSPFKRLPSFRAPRDLKLSEFREVRPNLLNENRTKKVFVPNLNIQRKKNADVDKDISSTNNDTSKSDSKEKNKRDSRERGRGRKQVNFIQGTGIFSEGLAPTLKHWHNSKSSESSSIPKPKLNINKERKFDKEEEAEVIKELLKDDFVDDPDNQPDLLHCPVALPLQDCKYIIKKSEKELFAKEEVISPNLNGVKVKKEPGGFDNEVNDGGTKKVVENKSVDFEEFVPWTVPQMLSKSSDKNYLFFQIPSCLPNMRVSLQSSQLNLKKDNLKNEGEQPEKCVLRSLPPGRIGKLQILKSGKARLMLGDVKLWVESGTQTAFKQDLISINLDESKKTGSMVNLGDLATRMLVTPDWDSLLSKPS